MKTLVVAAMLAMFFPDFPLVVVRPAPEVHFLCRGALQAPLGPGQRIRGCYNPETNTMLIEDDAEVLRHELRHWLEGAWHP